MPNKCIDDTSDPCYYRMPDHYCGRKPEDGACIHLEEIMKRREKERKPNE